MKPRSELFEQATAAPHGAKRTWSRRLLRLPPRTTATLVLGGLLVATVLSFGGQALVITDPLPEHADVAIVLNGSFTAVAARVAEAMRLLREGRVAHVMVSVGAIYYYGEWLPDLVRRFIKQQYGGALAARVLICEGLGDGTADEMVKLRRCLRSTDWQSAIIVTSDFHTRRTNLTLRAILVGWTPVQRFTVHGVADGSFVASGWWHERRYAKTWLLEMTKLLWFLADRSLPGGDV